MPESCYNIALGDIDEKEYLFFFPTSRYQYSDNIFAILEKNVGQLAKNVLLAFWLHNTTHYCIDYYLPLEEIHEVSTKHLWNNLCFCPPDGTVA